MFLFPLTAETENHLKSKLFERTAHSLSKKHTPSMLLLHTPFFEVHSWKRNFTHLPVVKGQSVVSDYPGAEHTLMAATNVKPYG